MIRCDHALHVSEPSAWRQPIHYFPSRYRQLTILICLSSSPPFLTDGCWLPSSLSKCPSLYPSTDIYLSSQGGTHVRAVQFEPDGRKVEQGETAGVCSGGKQCVALLLLYLNQLMVLLLSHRRGSLIFCAKTARGCCRRAYHFGRLLELQRLFWHSRVTALYLPVTTSPISLRLNSSCRPCPLFSDGWQNSCAALNDGRACADNFFHSPLCRTGQAEDGGIFIYDLLQSPVIPVASAQLPRGHAGDGRTQLVDVGDKGAAGAAYSVAFNPRQRDLLATGDSRGKVIIWRMSWRLANKRPGEEAGLARLFKGSAGDVSGV